MAKDPAFLFYSQDFSTGTMFFNDEQTGKYIRLLCAQHQHGHLPEKHMLTICKAYDEDVFSKFEKDENGLYYNDRLENEIKRRKNYTESRKHNAQHPKKQKVRGSKAYAKHMENENEIENEDKTVTKISISGYENIKVSNTENEKLIRANGEEFTKSCYKFLSEYKIEKGYKTKSDYLTITRWVIDAVQKQNKNATNLRPVIGPKQTGAYDLLERARQNHAARGTKNDAG